ncbi:MAG: hypothetical protein K2W94_02295 [Alphaproteobacteria bacterium]|nr:hypothetical protein [Alphaproteobacteria bacterium]
MILLALVGLFSVCAAGQVFAMEEGVAASTLDTIVANVKMHAIKPEQFKFERVDDSFAREISGESDTWVIRGFRDTMADFELLKQVHGGTDPFVGLFLSRALSRKCEDNPFSQRTAPNPFYSVFVWKKTPTGEQEYMGAVGHGVQPSFGAVLGAGYKADEHADIIQSFVASGTRVLGEPREDGAREDKQVLDPTGKPLGLVSHYLYLKPTVGEEDLLGILESMYNAAVFAKGIGSLLPPENDATLGKQVRTVPHHTYMITNRGGAHDTILQKYTGLTGFVRHDAEGLNQFYSPAESVAYTRPVVIAAVTSGEVAPVEAK